MMNVERHLDARQSRRMAAEDRALARLERRENAAEALVGELMREGVTVFYINARNGSTKEFGRHYDAIVYLIRNNYV